MTGVVREREARVRLTIRGPSGGMRKIDAVIDTGFSSWLTLPRSLIVALRLTWYTTELAILADGNEVLFNVYEAAVTWNRRSRSIFVSESETIPLIGMALLEGCELNVQVRQGGKVTIRQLPETDPPRRRR